MIIAGFGARPKAGIRFYPCKLIVITFSTFVQFERVRAVLKGVAPDEARLHQPGYARPNSAWQTMNRSPCVWLTREGILYAT